MSDKITTTELKALIANKIKEIGIHDVLDNKAIDIIQNRVMNVYNHDHAKNNIPEMIPEAVIPTAMGNTEQGIFPNGGFGTGEPTGAGPTVPSGKSNSFPCGELDQPAEPRALHEDPEEEVELSLGRGAIWPVPAPAIPG